MKQQVNSKNDLITTASREDQRNLLPPSPSTSTRPAYTQNEVCDVRSRLLQCRFRRGSKGYHWQVAASAEYGSSRTRKFKRSLKQLIHSELHWLDAPERIKYKLSMFMHRCLDGTAPYCGTLHPSLCNCLKTSSSFCCQSSVCCAVILLEFIRTSSFLCSWPDDMKLTAETSKWSNSHHICFWTITLDIFLFRVLMYAAH